MADQNVVPKVVLDEERVRELIGHGFSRVTIAAGKSGRAQLANHLCVCTDTVKHAISGEHTTKLHTVFNALSFDQTALDPLLEEYGLRVVPVEHREAENATLPVLAAVHKIAEAEADGTVDHQELLAMENELRAAAGVLHRLIARTAKVRAA